MPEGGNVLISNQPRRVGCPTSCSFLVGPWVSGGLQLVFSLGLLFPFTEEFVTHVVEEPECSPPTWYLHILLNVYLDPFAGVNWVGEWWALGLSPSLGSCGFLGWVTMGGQGYEWSSWGTQSVKLCSWFPRLGSFQTFVGDAVAYWASCVSSSSLGGWLPPLLAPVVKPLLSHPCLDTSKVPCTCGALMQHHKGPLQVPLTSPHITAGSG